MRIYIVRIDLCRRTGLINDLLQLFILLLHSIDIRVYLNESFFEIIDLVVKDFVMLVHCHLAVYKGIDSLLHFCKVLAVEIFEFLH